MCLCACLHAHVSVCVVCLSVCLCGYSSTWVYGCNISSIEHHVDLCFLPTDPHKEQNEMDKMEAMKERGSNVSKSSTEDK